MVQSTGTVSSKNTVELATFYIGDALCGMDILNLTARLLIQWYFDHKSGSLTNGTLYIDSPIVLFDNVVSNIHT